MLAHLVCKVEQSLLCLMQVSSKIVCVPDTVDSERYCESHRFARGLEFVEGSRS